MKERFSLARGPWVALALTGLAFGLGTDRGFELDRSLVIAGQWWRVLSGHFVHYNPAHARGDIWAFFVWAALVEVWSRRLLTIAVALACAAIGAGVIVTCPWVEHYAGLSGVDVALFVVLLCIAHGRYPRARGVVWLGAIGLAGKTLYEVVVGHAILAPDLGERVHVLPAAHVFGAAAGILAWQVCKRSRQPQSAVSGLEARAES